MKVIQKKTVKLPSLEIHNKIEIKPYPKNLSSRNPTRHLYNLIVNK